MVLFAVGQVIGDGDDEGVEECRGEQSAQDDLGVKFNKSFVPGLILWHAHVPIDQLAIALDLEA